jgi:hypothetical protein
MKIQKSKFKNQIFRVKVKTDHDICRFQTVVLIYDL